MICSIFIFKYTYICNPVMDPCFDWKDLIFGGWKSHSVENIHRFKLYSMYMIYTIYGEMIDRNQESVEFQQATNDSCNLNVETWLKWFWSNECYYAGKG